ncbi:hypothetical protein JMA_31560 [Jeotgalibacillus malaysiensis]|uniref:Uncharacterized protein n=1 Tax=Jeotgalibacillus malaysiensis TaxID=1508404 RepID=A0A0B5AV46_9BACL|nr:hypothetical protein JMA_31560 [Jeotgalibacillus malaysiensis]
MVFAGIVSIRCWNIAIHQGRCTFAAELVPIRPKDVQIRPHRVYHRPLFMPLRNMTAF